MNYSPVSRSIKIAALVFFSLYTLSINPANSTESVTAKENLQTLIKTGVCVGCDLSEVNFTRMDLGGVNLENADLSLCKFSLANLAGANLRGAKLNGASFGGADLGDADLRGADLRGVNFDAAYLGGTKLDGSFVSTEPYAGEGVTGIEKDVYVSDQATPKKVPVANDVKVAKRRDLAEPPPVLTPVAAPPKKTSAFSPMAAPNAKKITPMKVAMVEVQEETGAAEKTTTDQKALVVEKTETAAVVAKQKSKPAVNEEKPAITPPVEEKIKVKPVETSGNQVVQEKEVEPQPKDQPGEQPHAKEIEQLLDTRRCYACDLEGVDLTGKNLGKADLEQANLRGAVLRKVNLRRANMKGADLSGATLEEADLRDADLYKAVLSDADLTGARTEGALFDSAKTDGTIGLQREEAKTEE